MITLSWHQVSDNRDEARHDGVVLTVERKPNWDRHPQMNFDHHAYATRDSVRTDLGKHSSSIKARDKCAEFINSKQTGDSQT